MNEEYNDKQTKDKPQADAPEIPNRTGNDEATSGIRQKLRQQHPGFFLRAILDDKQMQQKELAAAIGKTTPFINDILKARRDVNPEIALLLETLLPDAYSAEDWMKMQTAYDLAVLRQKRDLAQRQTDIKQWNKLKAILRLRALKKSMRLGDDIRENTQLILHAMGETTVDDAVDNINRVSGFYRKSEKTHTDPVNLLTWCVMARHHASLANVAGAYGSQHLPNLRKALSNIFFDNSNTIERVGQTMSEFGIRFVYEPRPKALEGVPVDGYSYWSDSYPTIAVTGRINRLDNLAFTIFHELGHIELHLAPNGKDGFIDCDSEVMRKSDKEQQADASARNAIWRGTSMPDAFGNIHSPWAAEATLRHIANQLHIHPAIVAGQFQHWCAERHLLPTPYAVCRDMLVKVR